LHWTLLTYWTLITQHWSSHADYCSLITQDWSLNWPLVTAGNKPQLLHITICKDIHIYVCLLFLMKFSVNAGTIVFLYIFPVKYNWRSKDNHWILLLKIIIIFRPYR
jgi:hypothetical protein